MITLDPGQQSLIRAAQELRAAADCAEADTAADPSRHLTELGVLSLLWLCESLLPDGLPVDPAPVGARQVGEILSAAETELRNHPISRYPDGALTLVVGLCDLIRQTAASPT